MPMPRFSDDDVIQYMVVEAIVARAGKRAQDDQKKQKRDEWKSAAHAPGFKS